MKKYNTNQVGLLLVLLLLHASVGAKTITVNGDGSGDFTSIQAAIADVGTMNGDEIVVFPGTYFEIVDLLGKDIILRSSNGPADTTIDGNGFDTSVVKCISGETPAAVVSGFTITGGNATGSFPADLGGGMCCENSNPTIQDCSFIGNTATYGGGIGNVGSSPMVIDCRFIGNTTDQWGGGVFNESDSPTITNCTFIGNSGGNGGGMANQGSSPTVINSVFRSNTATGGGGGVFNFVSSPTLTNCTFSLNTADVGGGGIFSESSSGTTVNNSILWGDSPDEINNNSSSTTTVRFSNVQGGFPPDTIDGGDNIEADPLFADGPGGNVRLMRGSPCIDAGNNGDVPPGLLTDIDGLPRFVDDLCTEDTGNGNGDIEIVDMGAHEFMRSDILRDGMVDFADYGFLGLRWLDVDCEDCGGADLTCDGDVDVEDIAVLIDNWLAGKI